MKQFLKSLLLSAFAVTLFSTVSYASLMGNNSTSPYEEVYESVAVPPSYLGGDAALKSFINQNIRYPQAAQDNGIQGKVVVQFVVEKDGSVGEVKVARGVDPELDQEAVRVCKMLTGFTPGRNREGKPVSVWYTLPVKFKLTSPYEEEEITPEDPNVTGEALIYYQDALNGDAYAQYSLGCCYYNGKGVNIDYIRAFYWFKKSADQDNINALDFLELYNEIVLPGYYALEKDYDRMRYWYQKRHKIDDEYIDQYDTGALLYNVANDIYPSKDYLPILQDAVNQGSNGALSTLACLYALGKDVERDDNKAIELYRQYLENLKKHDENISIADVYYSISRNYSNIVREQYDIPQEQWLNKAAELGSCDAQNALAEKYAFKGDYENALIWWKKAAANNNSDAMRKIGDCYEKGDGVALDHKAAFQWYKKAADNGDDFSQNFVGECYLKGDVVSRNEKEAAKYFIMSAKNGNNGAMYNLGKCYYEGKGTKKDFKQSAEWFAEICGIYLELPHTKEFIFEDEELYMGQPKTVDMVIGGIDCYPSEELEELHEEAMQGKAWAQYRLGMQYYNNDDIQNALLWLEKAGENGYDYACLELINIYCYGQKVERDYNKALYWYKKEYEYRNENATIGDMLCDFAKEDYNSNKNKYLFLLQEASDFGSTDALLNLASIYAIGKDVPRDDDKAVKYYKNFLETIEEPTVNVTISDVYYLIYCYYDYSEIIKESCDGECDQWLEKAAGLGNADAQCEMGNLSNDQEEAITWYGKAAEQGHAGAQCEMGNYYNDKGDFAQAAQWFTKAAAQDEPEAQYRLATLYSTGNGVKKDKKIANEYYYKSATGFKASAEETLGIE
ncbi:MAG: TonB family protein [Muribaculaceae bacterium]|nr:TonB family protein [Muribaculaceae bacterium]